MHRSVRSAARSSISIGPGPWPVDSTLGIPVLPPARSNGAHAGRRGQTTSSWSCFKFFFKLASMSGSKTPVNWLRAFEVAARHLSFSAAAEELRVTPSAVSQQVRLLEHRLGHALFQRLPRGLRLTGAGEALVPVCRESFGRLDAALLELFG